MVGARRPSQPVDRSRDSVGPVDGGGTASPGGPSRHTTRAAGASSSGTSMVETPSVTVTRPGRRVPVAGFQISASATGARTVTEEVRA